MSKPAFYCNMSLLPTLLFCSPIIETFKSAHACAISEGFASLAITREEYNEGGINACRRKFRQFDWDPVKDKADEAPRSVRRDKDKAKAKAVEGSDTEETEGEPRKKLARKVPMKKMEKRSTPRPRREVARLK